MSNNKDFEEEPPSYDHAIQTNDNPVYQYGKYKDATIDSYERDKANQVRQHGFLRVMHIDNEPQTNALYRHPQGQAFITDNQHRIRFWPQLRQVIPDHDVTAQGSHPFLTLEEYGSEYRQQTQHYFEITVEDVSKDAVVAIGLTTRPYPIFRMPGWNKFSVGYHSDDGHKFCDDATGGQAFGPSWGRGDTVGCGYCPESGQVYFTKNGQMIDTAFWNLTRHYYFPSVGIDGPGLVQVNFGQLPFRFPVEHWAGQFI